MISQSKCIKLDGKDDAVDYQETVKAMGILGIPENEQAELFQILSGILLLGNIEYDQDDDDHAVFKPGTEAFVDAAQAILQCGDLTVRARRFTRNSSSAPNACRLHTHVGLHDNRFDIVEPSLSSAQPDLARDKGEGPWRRPTPLVVYHRVQPSTSGGRARCRHQGHLHAHLRLDR